MSKVEMSRRDLLMLVMDSLDQVLVQEGFRRRGTRFELRIGKGKRCLIEAIIVRRDDYSCCKFRLYCSIYDHELMTQVADDYKEKGAAPLFMVEPHEVATRFFGERVEMPRDSYPTTPLAVCGNSEVPVISTEVAHLVERYFLPFVRVALTTDGVLELLAKRMAYGHVAKSDAYLRILQGCGERWHLKAPIKENIRRAGLDPDSYKFGWDIRSSSS